MEEKVLYRRNLMHVVLHVVLNLILESNCFPQNHTECDVICS